MFAVTPLGEHSDGRPDVAIVGGIKYVSADVLKHFLCCATVPSVKDLQVGPLDPADAARGIPPGHLGGKDELIQSELVGSCCFYFLCYSFQPGQMFLYFASLKEP